MSLGRFTVDFYWPDASLVVEVDGYHAHAGRAAVEIDRDRDAELTALGFIVIRFTWRQVNEAERRSWRGSGDCSGRATRR